jgi:uncharacterized membrane protein
MSNQPPYGQNQGGGYPPPPPQGDKTKVLNLDYNVAAMLGYVPICCINLIAPITWLATEPKENRFVRFHALQSLFLSGAAIVVFCALWFISLVAVRIFFGFGLLILLLEIVLSVVFLILFIVGAVKAYQHQMWKIPVIGDMAEKNC